MEPNSPLDESAASSTQVLEVSRQTKTEQEDSSMTAPLESPEEFHDEVDTATREKPKEEEDDGVLLFPRFGEFNGDHQKSEDDLQHKENGNKEGDIQLVSRFGEFDGFGTGAGSTQPFFKSGIGGRTYPESLFSFPVNEARSEFGGVNSESIPDVNIYQNKKTVAQGMMDLALFSANANQLRYVLESKDHPYFWPGVIFTVTSLILQVIIGCGLLMNTRYNVKDKKEICIANRINNLTIIGIFLLTVINVFICAFGVVNGPSAAIFIGPRSGEMGGEFNDTNSELDIFDNQTQKNANIL